MQVHRLLKYSIDLIRSASAYVVFVVDLIELRLPRNMASISMSLPAFVIAKRPLVITSKCRARF